MIKRILILASFCSLFFCSCNLTSKEKLIIFHAGSLSVPFKQIAKEFEKQNSQVKVVMESAGSRACARKISDLNKPCDIMASADYKVIDNLLIPDYADWNLKFATNEMAIVYTNKSKFSQIVNQQNWMDILLNEKVHYGRSDPDSDPCGYRAVLVAKLAQLYYQRNGFADSLLQKDTRHMRPKEVDLIALLETQVIDYIFLYRSVAEQHGLKFVLLPDSLNLNNADLTSYYNRVSVKVSGKKPGEYISHLGEPMVYGITQPLNSPNPELAQKFLEFFFADSVGIKIMEQNGQASTLPVLNTNYSKLPKVLRPFALAN